MESIALEKLDKLQRTLLFAEHERRCGPMPAGLKDQMRSTADLDEWTKVRAVHREPLESIRESPVSTRRVRLRVLTPSDYPVLYENAVSPSTGYRWRYRGTTPSFETFVGGLQDGVFVQYVAEGNPSGRSLGYLVGYNANYSSGYCHLAVERFGPSSSGLMMEAACLFVSLLFRNWAFRRIYAEVIDFNFSQIASGDGRFFRVVADVPEKEFFAGRYWSLKTLEFERSHWETAMERIEPLLGIVW